MGMVLLDLFADLSSSSHIFSRVVGFLWSLGSRIVTTMSTALAKSMRLISGLALFPVDSIPSTIAAPPLWEQCIQDAYWGQLDKLREQAGAGDYLDPGRISACGCLFQNNPEK